MCVGVTLFLLAFLVVGLFLAFFILWFVQLFLTGWLLKEIWRPGWVPATDATDQVARSLTRGIAPITEGFRVPPPREHHDPVPDAPRTAAEVAGIVLVGVAGAALVAVFTWGSPEMRVGAIMLATLLGMYAFFRSFLT